MEFLSDGMVKMSETEEILISIDAILNSALKTVSKTKYKFRTDQVKRLLYYLEGLSSMSDVQPVLSNINIAKNDLIKRQDVDSFRIEFQVIIK